MKKSKDYTTWIDYQTIEGNPFLSNDGNKLLVSDQILITKCIEGDEQDKILAWNAINYFYGNMVFKTLCEISNPEDARDSLSEALLELSQRLHRARNRSSIGSWLSAIAFGMNANYYRHRENEDIIEVDTEELKFDQMAEETPESISNTEDEILERFYDSLSEQYRLTFKVRHLSQLELLDEIEEIRLIAKRSHYKNDTPEKAIIRIDEVKRKLQDNVKEVQKRETDLTKLYNSLIRLENSINRIKSNPDSEIKIGELRKRIIRIERRRERLLNERAKKGIYVKTKYEDIADILGEPVGTIAPRLHYLAEKIENYLKENSIEIIGVFLAERERE